jgi:hypothetical protein
VADAALQPLLQRISVLADPALDVRGHTAVDLAITTTDGQSLGGGGDKGNRNLLWERAAKEVVLGFSGRAGSELDALRAVVAIFGPVNWETVIEVEDP